MKIVVIVIALVVLSSCTADRVPENKGLWPRTVESPNKIIRRGTGRKAAACLPPEIKQALAHIEANWGKVVIVSDYRPGATIRSTGRPSYHASCRAVDFHPAPGTYKPVLNWLRSSWNGGLGTYSGRFNHIHIDTGPYVRFHNG